MPRNGEGTYLPTSGVTEIVPGATADAVAVQTAFLDLGNEITNSLPVDGTKAMSDQLQLAAGSNSGAPALSFEDAQTSGLHTDPSDNVGIAASGIGSALFGSAAISLLRATTVSDDLTTVGDIVVRDPTDSTTQVLIDNDTGNITSQGIISVDEVRYLNGDAYPFPAGTRLMFQNSTAPTGWLKETSANYNEAFIRLTTSTVGTGGSRAFTTSGFSITLAAELPKHTHGPGDYTARENSDGIDSGHNHRYDKSSGSAVSQGGSGPLKPGFENANTENNSQSRHEHKVTGTSGDGGTNLISQAIPLKYASFIIATKS